MWRFNVATDRPERIPSDDEASISAEQRPTRFDTTEFGKFLDVAKDKLSVRYTGNGLHDNDVGSIQADAPVPRRQLVFYYELTVLHAGERGLMSIGFAEKTFKLGRHPGWEPNSYGYHAEDGRKLTGIVTPSRHAGDEYGPAWAAGDTVGAGILLHSQEMFFTHNGKMLGTAFKNVLRLPLYPTVGLHSRKEHVRVNFGGKGGEAFAFDVGQLLHAERTKRQQALQGVRVASGDVHQVVRDYLLHFGYADTLRAFVGAAGLGGGCASASSSGGGASSAGGSSSSSSSSSSSVAEASLPLRARLRALVSGGDAEGAHALLQREGLMPQSEPRTLRLYFFVKCLAFAELVRQGKAEAAVGHAQSVLSPLRCMLAGESAAYDAMLADTIALLAYADPRASPLSALLGQAQREAVADVVNAAVLEARGVEAQGGSQEGAVQAQEPRKAVCQCALERGLHQLLAVQAELHAANGGHGQPFRLSEHLRPPPAAPPPPANGTARHANGFGHS